MLLLSLLFTIISYNCENLFDCRHDSLKNDVEFLPDAPRHWTFGRYWQKLNNLGRVIQQCGGDVLPDIAALLEVENDSTLVMFTRGSVLKGAGYRYVMTDSPDARGIDVALIYNPLTFRLESSYAIRPQIGNLLTRDILYAKGVARARDTLHIFAVHAPSRRNGQGATEPLRMQVMRRLMQSVDSIRGVSPDAKIILLGDFNDYSHNKALKEIVKRGFTEVSRGIKGLNYDHTGVKGTYKYQGRWDSLDHIFVTDKVMGQVRRCFIYDALWLLEEDSKGGYKPFRTYLGPLYHKGVSDHLPIVMEIRVKNEE
jgi:exonuclease III